MIFLKNKIICSSQVCSFASSLNHLHENISFSWNSYSQPKTSNRTIDLHKSNNQFHWKQNSSILSPCKSKNKKNTLTDIKSSSKLKMRQKKKKSSSKWHFHYKHNQITQSTIFFTRPSQKFLRLKANYLFHKHAFFKIDQATSSTCSVSTLEAYRRKILSCQISHETPHQTDMPIPFKIANVCEHTVWYGR